MCYILEEMLRLLELHLTISALVQNIFQYVMKH